MNGSDRLASVAAERARYAGMVVVKPWGHERQVFCNPDMSLWSLTIDPGCETSLHRHPNKTTMLFVVAGVAQVEVEDKVTEVAAGHSVLIERGALHRTRSAGGVVLLELESPPNKRDLERVEDAYGRTGKGYEV